MSMQPSKYAATFSQQLHTVLKDRDMSARHLAEISGVSYHSILNYSCGRAMPDYDNILKIADALGVTLDFLLGRSDLDNSNVSYRNPTNLSGYPWNVLEEAVPEWGDQQLDFSLNGLREWICDSLTEREQKVIELRWRDNKTLEEVGKEFGVTRERIRQVEAKAFRKLRHPTRLKKHACIAYTQWEEEKRAKEKAEERLDAFLSHGVYRVEMDTPAMEAIPAAAAIHIEEMDLSVRSFNCLARHLARKGITRDNRTLQDVLNMDENELTQIRNLGKRSLEEIVNKVHQYGYKMRWENA